MNHTVPGATKAQWRGALNQITVGWGLVVRDAAGRASQWRTSLDAWLLLLLALLALASRLFTNGLYAGEPTSDEYFFGIYARDLASALQAGSLARLSALFSDSHLVGLVVGLGVLIRHSDPIALGRLTQATFNALTVPLVYVLARVVGLNRIAGIAAGALMVVIPETWETAWRFWADSQAGFLALASLIVGLRMIYTSSRFTVALLPTLIGLTFLTKEYTAVAALPALVVACVAAIRQHARGDWRRAARWIAWIAVPTVGAVLFMLLFLSSPGLRDWLQDTWVYGPTSRVTLSAARLLAQLPYLLPEFPAYVRVLSAELGVHEFGIGVVVCWVLGAAALAGKVSRSVLQARHAGDRRGRLRARLLWVLVGVIWLPIALFGLALAGEALGGSPLMLGLLLGGAALVGLLHLKGDPVGNRPGVSERISGQGLFVIGLFTLSFVALRFSVWAAPDLRAAFTPRSFQPTFPIVSLLAGWGVAALASALASPLSQLRFRRSLTLVASLGLIAAVTLALNPTLDHVGNTPLVGQRADRDGDVATPGGLRVTVLVEAERWLQANLLPSDELLTGIPRQVVWYADTGVDGLRNAVIMGDLGQSWDVRRAKMMDLLRNPSNVDYVIDFNIDWTRPEVDRAQQWYAFHDWLRTRPYLEEVYARRDPNGRVVFYVFRNHRWAASPSYVDREEARALALASPRH